jgi:hypothetical protein
MARNDVLSAFALEASVLVASVAAYSDHIDHNEVADISDVRAAAAGLRELGRRIIGTAGETLPQAWAERLSGFEVRHPALEGPSDAPERIRRATTWRETQVAQYDHDRLYHPDIIGLAKRDQLLHAVVHIAKASGDLAKAATCTDAVDGMIVRDRAVDLAVFGVKLATLCGERLPEDSVLPSGVVGDPKAPVLG